MRKPLTVIIVTLFALKGMSRWLIQRIKAMLLCIVYGILFVDTVNTNIKACNALNAMFIETVNTACTGVCGSYITPHTEYYEVWKLYSTLYKVASHPCQEGRLFVTVQYLKSLLSWGLAVHRSVRGGSFVNSLGLVKLQGWLQARHTANS